MSQSLTQLYVHLTFGTKGRQGLIPEAISEKLHAYIAGILKEDESPALLINSVPDHIHILFRLSKNYSLAKIVEDVKKLSSKWMKTQNQFNFSWQGGYGAFSVSSSKLSAVKRYIENQKEHHKKVKYQEELEAFMKEYGVINYASEYYWEKG